MNKQLIKNIKLITLKSSVYLLAIAFYLALTTTLMAADHKLPYYTFLMADSFNVSFNTEGETTSIFNLKRGKTKKTYRILSFGYNPMYNEATVFSEQNEPDYNIEAKVIGMPLFYPNPFKLRETARLGYELSKNMDIEIRMYDMRGNEIFKENFASGTVGGLRGYNNLYLTAATFNNYDLPSGIYFFILINNQKVMARGKFAIMP